MNDQPKLIDAPIATTMNDRIKAVQREIQLRKRVYPRWVEAGKLKPEAAAFQIKCMEDVYEMLVRLQHTMDV